MLRRNFFKLGLKGTALTFLAPKSFAQTVQSPPKIRRKKLSQAHSELVSYYDRVIVGSGYGGAIMAARCAGLDGTTAILERGKEWQASDFPDTAVGVAKEISSELNPLGLYKFYLNQDVDVWVGNGLGGTSLINAGVAIAPNPELFHQKPWPQEVANDSTNGRFQEYMNRVRRTLKVTPYPDQFDELAKTSFQRATAKVVNDKVTPVQFQKVDVAVTFESQPNTPNSNGVPFNPCTHCGDCATGCNIGAKNTLDTNYLAIAKQKGVKIFTQIEVDFFERDFDDTFTIYINLISANGKKTKKLIRAKHLILAAGTLGSTHIMLKSQRFGNLKFSSLLGKRFSGNGDVLGATYSTPYQLNTMGFGQNKQQRSKVGPLITSAIKFNTNKPLREQFVVEEGTFPSAVTALLRPGLQTIAGLPHSPDDSERRAKDLICESESGALNHSLMYLAMGHDSADGQMSIDNKGQLSLSWPQEPRKSYYDRIYNGMRVLSDAGQGQFIKNPRHTILGGNNIMTVHPTGGCPMGSSIRDGVVNHKGQVFDGESSNTKQVIDGLYIVDGSIAPTSIGVNLFLTISALAERAAELYVADHN